MDPRILRHHFLDGLIIGLRVVWPVLSILLILIVGLGFLVGMREGWSIGESGYFAFITGLTIGYGDFAPKSLLGRILSIGIGGCGILLTALLAAVAVKALTITTEEKAKPAAAEKISP